MNSKTLFSYVHNSKKKGFVSNARRDMRHWSEKYVGREYRTGVFDCADLLKLVMHYEFGRDIKLPNDRDWRTQKPENISDYAREFASQTTIPIEGDAILMRIVGRKYSLGGHVGILSIVKKRQWVLHSIQNVGCIFHPVKDLATYHLEPVGFYQWL